MRILHICTATAFAGSARVEIMRTIWRPRKLTRLGCQHILRADYTKLKLSHGELLVTRVEKVIERR